MPARSKSQQRLFGMLHAYNKGELKGSKSLKKKMKEMSRHISDEDATHFAKTPHDDLPEKVAAHIRALEKIAEGTYLVNAGDTLSGISKKTGTPIAELQRLNGISNPNQIFKGQNLRTAGSGRTIPFNEVSEEIHRQFGNPALEAAILANIDRETGGTFSYRQNEKGVVKGGYGLFQLTGKNRRGYTDWLSKNRQKDSVKNQISYMKSVYGPRRQGWKNYTGGSDLFTREQLADWWHRKVETPAHVIQGNSNYSPEKIELMTKRHNEFMKRLKPGKNGWTI